MAAMEFCLVCKEIVGTRYQIQVGDKKMDTSFNGFVCRFCFHKFVDSFYNKGFFKMKKMINWLRGNKDPMRAL